MLVRPGRLLGRGGRRRYTLDLVAAELRVPSPLVVTRVGGGSLTESDGDFAVVGTDVARFDYVGASPGLLLEGGATDLVRNPRGEYTSAPAFPVTAMPQHWAGFSSSGLTTTFLGYFTLAGVTYLRMQVSGTPSASFYVLALDTVPGFTASAGQAWALSIRAAHVAGTYANIGQVNFTARFDPSGTAGGATVTIPASQPHVRYFTPTGVAPAGTTVVYPVLALIGMTAGVPVDVTFDLASVQAQQAAFLGSEVLPSPGSRGPTTRFPDVAQAPWLAVAPRGECTVLFSAVLPAPNQPVTQVLVGSHDGTNNNTVRLRLVGGTGSFGLARSISGSVNTIGPGGIPAFTTPGPIRCGYTVARGRVAVTAAGASAVNELLGAPPAMTTFQIGARNGGAEPLFGRVAVCRVLPYAMSDAALQAAVNDLPVPV